MMFDFTNSFSCIILEETVMSILANNLESGMGSEDWKNSRSNCVLQMELLEFVKNHCSIKNIIVGAREATEIDRMGKSTLRENFNN